MDVRRRYVGNQPPDASRRSLFVFSNKTSQVVTGNGHPPAGGYGAAGAGPGGWPGRYH